VTVTQQKVIDMSIKRALVMSHSTIHSDPRVLREVEWLSSDGWAVDTVGFGNGIKGEKIRHFEVRMRPFPIRVPLYAILNGSARYKILVESQLPELSELGNICYDLVLANDLDFLPWCTDIIFNSTLSDSKTKWHLDLHEYFGDQGHGTIWKLLFRKYHQWLFGYTTSDIWTTRSTVAEGIADLYSKLVDFKDMKIVRNAPRYSGLLPTLPQENTIKLVYHGVADLDRGLEELVRSVKHLDERFELHLLLMGNSRAIKKLKRAVLEDSVEGRVFFHNPVEVEEIPEAINPYDLEVIFFPPVTENLRHALPNKFFEAVQASIGVVIGDSPNMRAIVDTEKFGLVVDGWQFSDLVSALNGLNRATVNEMKINASNASKKLNSEYERTNFLSEIANGP
jgi:glycosyltransferase involved in cell wall biosynthesis